MSTGRPRDDDGEAEARRRTSATEFGIAIRPGDQRDAGRERDQQDEQLDGQQPAGSVEVIGTPVPCAGPGHAS